MQPEVQLSEAVCQLTDDVRTALQANFRGFLASLGREIVEEPEAKSALPDYVHEYLTHKRDLVDVSGDLAHLLWNSQTGNNPSGLLLVASARLAGERALLMVKLEQEAGMQAKETVIDGLRTFDMRYFADLLMTENNKVYKAALFSAAGITEAGLEGWAADKQLSGSNKAIATFFLQAFLGCRQKKDPRELTKGFHNAAVDWVDNHAVADRRIRYLMAVLVELQRASPTLDPTGFAADHLDLYDQDSFLEFLSGHNVPVRVFDKDTADIDNRLNQLRLGFDSGIFIVAPVETVREDITVEDHDDGTSTVTIDGVITSTRSYAGGRRKKDARSADGSAAPDTPSA